MARGARALHRHAAVLVWVPVLFLAPVLGLPHDVGSFIAGLALVAVAAAACVVAVLGSWPRPSPRSTVALVVLAAAVLAGSLISALGGDAWSATWLLVAMAAAVALRDGPAFLAVPAVAVLAAGSLASTGVSGQQLFAQGFVVLLAGVTAGTISRLVLTAEELRRTREELAEAAVARERDRFARDLHDTLGHTLSVMVVKAAVVRRLVHTDPDAAADHAHDVEEIGRTALAEVRDTVDGTRVPRLAEELRGAREALDAAGIRAAVAEAPPVPATAGEPLAWALREGVTNVLRHSGASECRVALTRDDGAIRLTVADDGVGAVAGRADRPGGLDGLRQRLCAAGGGLEVSPRAEGFTITAWVPDGTVRR